MNWIEIKHEDYHPIQCMDGKGNIHHLMFSPISLSVELTEENSNPNDTKAIFVRLEENPNLEQVRNILANLIKEYDSSNLINYFNYLTFRYWFSKEERLAITHKFQVLLNKGEQYGLVWFGSHSYEVEVVKMLDFLEELELYAIQCNDITKQHLNEIKSIDNINDLIRFNITKDYPKGITMDVLTFKQ